MSAWLRAALAAIALGGALAGCGAPPETPALAAAPSPTGYKVVLVAGDPSIRAFDNATARLDAMLRQRDAARPADIQRFSARDDAVRGGAAPATTPAVLAAIARLDPAPGEGCLVFATSHGVRRRGLELPRSPDRPHLTPAELDAALARGCGSAPTVVGLSGCYSGEYLRGPMRRPNRVVLTAARADRTSFGCGAGNTFTFFDECLLGAIEAAPAAGATWRSAFAETQSCVARHEQGRFVPSEPQSWFGRAVPAMPLPWRS